MHSQCWRLQVDLSKAWLTFSSIVLAFAFVFGNNIRNIYEAVIFLFVVHPFDVGDVLLMGADQSWCQARLTRHGHTFENTRAVHDACQPRHSLPLRLQCSEQCCIIKAEASERSTGSVACCTPRLTPRSIILCSVHAVPQVLEMALNNVVLQQANGIKVFYPITRMFTEPVYNVSRSANRWEGFRVSPHTSSL